MSRRLDISRAAVCLLALFTCLLGTGAAFAADSGTIVGKVVPPHDHDFVLSTARIPDLGLKTEVTADGSFRFDDVRPGTYIVEVRVPSLGIAVDRVEVGAGETAEIDIELKPGSHFEEIVVSASADARDPTELATASTILSGQELALRLQPTLGETLAAEPGVSSTFFGPGASRPVIRGLTGDRVRVLEGGLGTGDASGISADHAVTLDPAQAERIEILRGPATLLYGSSAIGGVVNVIDERVPSSRASRPIGGHVEIRGGSAADERSGTVNLDGGRGDWAWHVDFTAREADDYEVPGFARLEGDEHEEEGHDEEEHGEDEHEEEDPFGVVPNTDIETRGGRIGVSHFGDKGFFGISVSGFETDYGLPGGLEHAEHGDEHDEHGDDDSDEHGDEHDDDSDEHGDDDSDEHGDDDSDEHGEHEEDEHEEGVPVRIDMEQRRVDLRGGITQPFGAFEALKFSLGVTDYEHVELEGDEEGTFFFNEFLETRIELVQKRRGRHSGSVGLQYLDRELEAIGAEAFLPKTTTERWALFTFQEIDTGDVRWQFGGRFESQDTDPTSPVVSGRSHDGFSASAGLVWEANDAWSIGASLARSVKLPAAEELFSDGLHVATQAFEVGDPNLDEEVGLGLDLSFRYEGEGVSAELTLFRQDFDDFIFQAFTGDEEDGFPVVVYSQQDAEFTGAELKARIELYDQDGHHIHLSLVGDLVEAELDSGENLPRIPPFRLGTGLHYHSERWNASAEVNWVDDQNDVGVNESPTDGYTLVNASVGYRFLFSNQIFDLLLRGRNLTDEEARTHTSFLKNVAPLPGRDISLALKLLF